MKRLFVVCCALALMSGRLGAQDIARADSLLAGGGLFAAESLYYEAARENPHDPDTRWALGRYLASRGALRVAAVLLEEARKFGGDPVTIGRDLVPLYRDLGDYESLATMPASPLSAGERQQAAWLVTHSPSLVAPDTLTSVSYRPSGNPEMLGRVTIRVAGQPFSAAISPRRRGIVIARGTLAAARVVKFAVRPDGSVPAAADSVSIGSLSLVNTPVTVASTAGDADAVIGIDVLQRFGATFDPKAARITLRASGSVPATMAGERIPTIADANDLRLLEGQRFMPVTRPEVAAVLRTHRWTIDAKHGSLLVEP